MANTKVVLCPLSSDQLCSRQLARRGWRELRNVFVCTQGKADPGFKKSFWVIHSGCSHRERMEGRGHMVSVVVAAPAGSSADLTASAVWAGGPAGEVDSGILTCLSFAVTNFFFPSLFWISFE